MTQAMQEAAAVIRSFLDGTGGPWDWDDFLSPTAVDEEVRAIQDECLQLRYDYPPVKPGTYCSEAGMLALQGILEKIERTESSSAVGEDMTTS